LVIIYNKLEPPKSCNISTFLRNQKTNGASTNCENKLKSGESCEVTCNKEEGETTITVECNENGKTLKTGGCTTVDSVINMVHRMACAKNSTKLCQVLELLQNQNVVMRIQNMEPEKVVDTIVDPLVSFGIIDKSCNTFKKNLIDLLTYIQNVAKGNNNETNLTTIVTKVIRSCN
jgi:RecJ-like exonuclease